ncbi:hypothetical protein C8A00DRAFT_43418 [Chaetomidium leptoderma]|uniref:F-box domain-containing protein n=1 Tax=Chaetomidium leptoderma TaxID=669021 RepID=A0AAN6VLD9_9PEZI|nr:hypothetical protein C8A00DRAFT_43418 [Chaetomidium leptoderma]
MALPHGRSLRDLLFGRSADVLVRLLTVPVRPQSPPSSPPALSRNGRRPTQTTSSASRDSLRETRGDGQSHKRAEAQRGSDALAFSNLPPELHRLVFDHIEFIEDAVCLGLASRYFWTFAREYLDAYYMSFLGRWAGESIVCVGEDVKPGDYPPGLFSAEELDALQKTRADLWMPDDDHLEYVKCNESFTLFHFASPSVSVLEEVGDVSAEAWRMYCHCRDRAKHGDPALEAKLGGPALEATRSEIIATASTYTPQDQPWILRNLTTKEFVRSEAIAIKAEYVRGPNIAVLGFGEVVLSRICWSTSPSIGMTDTTNISRGVWAGHCFDITTLARHEDDTGGAEWSDVSDEVAREIANIWESEYGVDLREGLPYWYQRRPNRNYFDLVPP